MMKMHKNKKNTKGKKEPRRHHYIPHFYLKYFSNHNGKLFVFDMTKRRQWISSPKNVACQRDFYRVETDQINPLEIEKFLSFIESEAAKVINEIIRNRQIPQGTSFDVLLDYISLLLIRNKIHRDSFSGFINDILQGYLEMRFGPNSIEGIKISSEEFVKTAWFKYFIELAPKWRETLKQREWALYYFGKEKEGPLVTSDNPVGINPIDKVIDFEYGIGSLNTIVSLPLTKNILLLGTLGMPFTLPETPQGWAYFNYATIRRSRLIISPKEDFLIINEKGEITQGKEYIIKKSEMHSRNREKMRANGKDSNR